jgi:hypothetical protein
MPDNSKSRFEGIFSDNRADEKSTLQYDNMTSHTTSKQGIIEAENTDSKEPDNKAMEAVLQMVRQKAKKPAGEEVLKTVTIKMRPSMDARIERYCFEHGMKKQDFFADAVDLYFAAVEAE